MGYETIILKEQDGVATIVLNRPDNLNAMNIQMGKELLDAIRKCGEKPDVRAVIITGAGKAFCSGGDVKAMKTGLDEKHPDVFFAEILELLHKVILEIRNIKKPVLASVNGSAVGAGFNLALACDITIVSEKAKFSEAFVNIGLTPDTGGTFFLPRFVGIGKASELLFTGDFIDAHQAEKLGIANYVVSEGELENKTMEIANKLAKGPTLAISQTKALLNSSFNEQLDKQLENEYSTIKQMSLKDDFREGLTAFFEKRKPLFKGK